MTARPKIAIIDPNTLAMLGLKSILQEVMPILTVDAYGTFDEFMAGDPEQYYHYFVTISIVLENRQFFLDHRRRTIVLTMSTSNPISDFHSVCINVPEKALIRSLLALQQGGHPHGKNISAFPDILNKKILTNRELEVLSLIVQGFINKEIADRLNISLSTVITHRKNIMEKLGMRSVSALTIYAVMHGYVDINKI